jgi:RNA polymerase-binding transcription factor DksA
MDTHEAQRRLTVSRAETLRLIASMQADFDSVVTAQAASNADDEHDPEGATGAFERAQAAVLLTHAEHQLGEIAAALERVADDSYGRCERCDAAIASNRLEALPAARYCIACASGQT